MILAAWQLQLGLNAKSSSISRTNFDLPLIRDGCKEKPVTTIDEPWPRKMEQDLLDGTRFHIYGIDNLVKYINFIFSSMCRNIVFFS